jgi:hypothetical protein
MGADGALYLQDQPTPRRRVMLAVGGGLLASFIVAACLYFLPTIIAVARKVRNQGSIVVINFFLGWTLIGWVVALAMAFRTSD